MKKYTVSTLDYKTTYKNVSENSLAFENICSTETYDNGNEKSRLGLLEWENELLTIYLPSIIENSSIIDISDYENKRKYSRNPHRLSKDLFNVTDFWYIILAMNNYTNIYDFKDFDKPILIPDLSYLENLITDIERKKLIE